jgi:hypothetical protein
MRTKYFFKTLFISGLIIITSCKKETITFSNSTSSHISNDTSGSFLINETNLSLNSIAKELAVLLDNQEIRTLLKTEIGKKFDGDYEILLKDIKEMNTTKGISFQSYFSEKNSLLIDDLVRQISNLQLSIPVNYLNWEEKNFVPPVAYVPLCEDPEKLSRVEAYYSNGEKQEFTLQEDPSIPVLVIGYCERVDANGAVIFNTDLSSNKSTLTAKHAYLKKIRLDDLNEPWVNGAAELYLSVREKGDYGDPNYMVSSHYETYRDASIDRNNEGEWTGDKLWEMYPTAGSTMSWGYPVRAYDEAYYFWIEFDTSPFSPAPWPTSQTYGANMSGSTYYIYGTNISDYLGYNYVATTNIDDYTYSSPLILDSSTGDLRYSAYEN